MLYEDLTHDYKRLREKYDRALKQHDIQKIKLQHQIQYMEEEIQLNHVNHNK